MTRIKIRDIITILAIIMYICLCIALTITDIVLISKEEHCKKKI